jgi:hypothetical protein
MKRAITSLLLGIAAACACNAVLAHANVGVYLGVPGPVYAAPPPVVYQPYPPPVDRRQAPTGMAMATVIGATTGTIAVGVKMIGIEVGTTITAVGMTAVGTTTDRPRHGRNTPRPSYLTTNGAQALPIQPFLT